MPRLATEAELRAAIDRAPGRTGGAFERDRKRDQRLVAAGFRVIRVTWRQLVGEPLALIARIAQALTARAPA